MHKNIKIVLIRLLALLLIIFSCVSSAADFYVPEAKSNSGFIVPEAKSNSSFIVPEVKSGKKSNRSKTTPIVPSSRKKMEKCGLCKNGKRTCTSCHGAGVFVKTKRSIDLGYGASYYTVNERCRVCSGSGFTSCLYCGGRGVR